jgi:D-beta-D-heptose 7-phosphate kinase / D-beta-D-heptose 1-phosphate adenosyltransferase
MTEPLVIVGDSLLDRDIEGSVNRLCPDAPVPVVDTGRTRARPGGAALAATLAARAGRAVTLVTALAEDAAAEELRNMLGAAGVDVFSMASLKQTPEKIRVRAAGRTLIRLDRGSIDSIPLPPSERALRAISRGTVLVSDYGHGVTSEAAIRSTLTMRAAASVVVWDPHPRGAIPVPGCRLVTPNRSEAGLAPAAQMGDAAARARELAREWRATYVAITLGDCGALVSSGLGMPLAVPAPHVAHGDPCGAGDCFAVTAASLLADGATPADAVISAVAAASSFVAAGGAAGGGFATWPPLMDDAHQGLEAALRVAAETRARGGRVVATGGCFDILHAGHVASLRAARELGGCLIVCMNSDESVRRLKGPSRPIVGERDRAKLLCALSCVDAVVVFDDESPAPVMKELRPDIFVKGGDYELAALPEAQLVRTWGGEAVLVPYVDGYSTTRLLEQLAGGTQGELLPNRATRPAG